jgi:hypothetical protein
VGGSVVKKQLTIRLPLQHDCGIVQEGNVSRQGTRFKRIRLIAAVVTVAAVSFAGGCVVAAQPHMVNALNALQSARGELQVAEHDKGGHRVNALRLINEAIGEVQAGIAAGS